MLKMPVARFWRGENFDEYKSHLHEMVPAWKDLNDALFWQSVEEARGRLETKKSERLIDPDSIELLIGFYSAEDWGAWSRTGSPWIMLPHNVLGPVIIELELVAYGTNIDRELSVQLGAEKTTIDLVQHCQNLGKMRIVHTFHRMRLAAAQTPVE